MAYRTRRKVDVALIALGAVLAGVVSLIAAAAGDTERVSGYWASGAVVGPRMDVLEVIDYDFGPSSRHGIFRDVPDLLDTPPPTVSSPTAPDQVLLQARRFETRIRVGDPNRTIRGRHRYQLTFSLDGILEDGRVSWNAVGHEWTVGISDIELHLLSAQELTAATCSKGSAGSWGGCSVETVAPGHLLVHVDSLGSGEGVTISADLGEVLTTVPTPPTPPSGPASDPGSGLVAPALIAAAAALLGAIVTSRLIRKRGRELVWAGGSADAAFGPVHDGPYATRLIDHEELDSLASTEFVPPDDLAAWQGGVLHVEHATKDHRVAWLLERAIAGDISIELQGSKEITIHRADSDTLESATSDAAALTPMFGGRSSVDLGKYDKQFAAGWSALGSRLDRWYGESGLWDPDGDRRKRKARIVGALAFVAGLVVMAGSAVFANRATAWWLIGVGAGAAIVGVAWALLVRSWELRVRTPYGSGLWIRVESFRRFIENSDAQHVDDAAKRGALLVYTAWAVALGEVDRWSKAVNEAGQIAPIDPTAIAFATMAPRLSSATARAATAPSSSSGGGGGSVGGGGGGGGGGSW